MTATRFMAARKLGSSTCSGRFVSTTTRRLRPSAESMASWGVMKAFLYSGSAFRRSMSSLLAFFSGSMTILHILPFLRAMQQTAASAPTASRSAYLWPMTKTREESATSSARAFAMTRLLTFVRVSTSLPRPPKNSKEKRFFMTAWSPPRVRAISAAREANCQFSPKPSPSRPMPRESVACMPEGLVTVCARSSMANLSSRICCKCRSSKMMMYLSRS